MSAFPSRIHARATLGEYQLCKQTGQPLYHEFGQVLCGRVRRYTRILLPLSDDHGRVARLAYGVQVRPLLGPANGIRAR